MRIAQRAPATGARLVYASALAAGESGFPDVPYDPTMRDMNDRIGRRGTRAAVLLVAATSIVLALAGCGGDSTADPAAPPPASGAVLPGGGLSVAEAISTDAEPPLAVGGWIVGSGDDARLCSGYAAAAADPCVEPSLALEGADSEESGTRVSLLGAVEGDTFVVSSAVQG